MKCTYCADFFLFVFQGYGDTDRRGNNDDEMGEDLDFVDLGVTPLRLYSGDKHSCIITPNNSIKCFGEFVPFLFSLFFIIHSPYY